jgi:alpha-glucosidase (family GH31 glycosyl hydrolase)
VPAEHGLGTMPLYLREGAVIPMRPVSQWVGERPRDPLTLVVAPFEGEGGPGKVVLDAPDGVELAP